MVVIITLHDVHGCFHTQLLSSAGSSSFRSRLHEALNPTLMQSPTEHLMWQIKSRWLENNPFSS